VPRSLTVLPKGEFGAERRYPVDLVARLCAAGRLRVQLGGGLPDAASIDRDRSRDSGRGTLNRVREVQARGAGEIVLSCIASDGVRKVYDLPELKAVREQCQVPLVASGGAGTMEHLALRFDEQAADAALAASVFHGGQIAIPDVKRYVRDRHNEVRP
jgi:imidazole glycerol-phosphate synthase subunit HisF